MIQSTFVLIKPDAIRDRHLGEICTRIEQASLKILELRMLSLTMSQIVELYPGVEKKAFFPEFFSYLTSGPVVALKLEGFRAVERMINLCGDTDPLSARAGTIRGDFGRSIDSNVIHRSDSVESAIREAAIFF